jgi:hypothetical protein
MEVRQGLNWGCNAKIKKKKTSYLESLTEAPVKPGIFLLFLPQQSSVTNLTVWLLE